MTYEITEEKLKRVERIVRALIEIRDYVPTTETHDYEVVISLKRIANEAIKDAKQSD